MVSFLLNNLFCCFFIVFFLKDTKEFFGCYKKKSFFLTLSFLFFKKEFCLEFLCRFFCKTKKFFFFLEKGILQKKEVKKKEGIRTICFGTMKKKDDIEEKRLFFFLNKADCSYPFFFLKDNEKFFFSFSLFFDTLIHKKKVKMKKG